VVTLFSQACEIFLSLLIFFSLDNSEWMRNGDYLPSRLDVQTEACNYIASLKHQANVENSVGVLTMAGKRYSVEFIVIY
jgi:hypothetical protein